MNRGVADLPRTYAGISVGRVAVPLGRNNLSKGHQLYYPRHNRPFAASLFFNIEGEFQLSDA